MSDYIVTIQRVEPNPAYNAERAKWDSNQFTNPPTLTTQVLTMYVTAEQFEAIRRAAIEVAK